MERNMKKAFIYTFKTYKNYYIYDFNTNTIIRVEKEVYDILNENRNELNDRVNAVTELEVKYSCIRLHSYKIFWDESVI